MNVRGTETKNQRASSAKSVVNGMAAELPLLHRTRFITKNNTNTTLKYRKTFQLNCRCTYLYKIIINNKILPNRHTTYGYLIQLLYNLVSR